jgi:ribosomal protein S10
MRDGENIIHTSWCASDSDLLLLISQTETNKTESVMSSASTRNIDANSETVTKVCGRSGKTSWGTWRLPQRRKAAMTLPKSLAAYVVMYGTTFEWFSLRHRNVHLEGWETHISRHATQWEAGVAVNRNGDVGILKEYDGGRAWFLMKRFSLYELARTSRSEQGWCIWSN